MENGEKRQTVNGCVKGEGEGSPLECIADLLEREDEEVFASWLEGDEARRVIPRTGKSVETFKEAFARPMFFYFLSVLRGKAGRGDCPIMRGMVELFHEKGLAAEEVFFNCTGMKNAVLERLFIRSGRGCPADPESRSSCYREVCKVLDANLGAMLAAFTASARAKEAELERQRKITEEHVALSRTDLEGTILYVSDAFCRLTGFPREELVGRSHRIIRHPDMPDGVFEDMWKTLKSGDVWRGRIKNLKRDGGYFVAKTEIAPVTDGTGSITGYVAIRHDITDKERALADPLTGLPNRRMFDDAMARAVEKAEVDGTPLSLIVTDVDRFKAINDTYGHGTGDRVLKEMAALLREHRPEGALCARWGGEEFVLLLEETGGVDARDHAELLRNAVKSHPFAERLSLTASFGVGRLRPGEGERSFFERVDAALYRAKRNGRDRVEFDG